MMTNDNAKTILIIEDEKFWQNGLKKLLERKGFKVAQAYDYSDAISQLQNLNPKPTLAIVDIGLPSSASPDNVYDGFHVLKALQKQCIYAIVLSGKLDLANSTPISERPEVLGVVDKIHFGSDPDFSEIFLDKVNEAVNFVEVSQLAEGLTPEQQSRLIDILLDSSISSV
ncbi:MAG: response regulator [Chloroflexota bacterium]